MSNRCPVCKARLWKGHLFRKTRCPRCGTEFRTTVPVAYFQLLFLVVILLSITVILILSQHPLWPILLLLLLLLLLFWFLPKIVRLEPDSPPLTVADGALRGKSLPEWEEDGEEDELSFGMLTFLSVALVAVLLILFLLGVLPEVL